MKPVMGWLMELQDELLKHEDLKITFYYIYCPLNNIIKLNYFMKRDFRFKKSSLCFIFYFNLSKYWLADVFKIKMTVFWYAAPCCRIEIDQCFRGAYCLQYQGDDSSL
jgi:hypothetical protein